MSDTDHIKPGMKFNFNTVIGVVMLGVLAWLGNTVLDSSRHIAEMKVLEPFRAAQLETISKKIDLLMPREEVMTRITRIEVDIAKTQADVIGMELEIVKLKVKP